MRPSPNPCEKKTDAIRYLGGDRRDRFGASLSGFFGGEFNSESERGRVTHLTEFLDCDSVGVNVEDSSRSTLEQTVGVSAQTASPGGLTGTLTDASGAVVPNSKITLRNYGTDETLTAITGQDRVIPVFPAVRGRIGADGRGAWL